ncbi:unnamed protein product [Brassica napus]|uniref:(rape) hypothetical protein n=1 Tax=Brassica napus TaxID=3708 RepID=A0A816IRX6_BRANA|nr:unnamed protein product [Brassica napus]
MSQISSSCRWRGQQIGSVPSSQSSRRPRINWDSIGRACQFQFHRKNAGMTRRCCWLMWTGCTPNDVGKRSLGLSCDQLDMQTSGDFGLQHSP